jgi:DNA-directed RNA polymerase specialized sigma24 family protein
MPSPEPSPLERALGAESFQRYDAALGQLSEPEREGVIARLELGCSYQEVALLLGKPSDDAARMTVARALERMAAVMSQAS